MKKNQVGLKIKVTLDDNSLKKALNDLKKGVEVPIKFDSASLSNMVAQIEKMNKLGNISLVNAEELKSLAKVTDELGKQSRLLEQQARGSRSTKTTDEEKKQLKDNNEATSKVLNLQKQINDLEIKSITAGEEKKKVYAKHIDEIQKECNQVKALITNETSLSKIENQRLELQQKLNRALEVEKANQNNLAKAKINKQEETESKTLSKEEKSINNTQYKELSTLQKQIYEFKTKALNSTQEEMNFYNGKVQKLQEKLNKQKELATSQEVLNQLKQQEYNLQEKYNTGYNENLIKTKELQHQKQLELNDKIQKFQASADFEFVDEAKFNTFMNNVKKLDGLTLKQIKTQAKQLSREFDELTSDAKIKRINNTSKSVGLLGTAFKEITKFASLTMVLRALWNEFQKGYDHIKTVDEAFTNMSMTMESLTREGFDGMLDKVNELSKSMGAVSSDVLKIAQTFANDSTSLQAVMDKLEPSIALMNISGMNPTEVTKSVMSIANSYQMLASDGSNAAEVTEYLGDVISKVSANMDMDFVKYF